MTLIQRLAAIVIALTISAMATTAFAEKKVLDVLVPYSNTGNNWKQAVMFSEALKSKGYDSEVVHTANCFKNNRHIKDSKRPGFYFLAATDLIVNAKNKECMQKVTKKTYLVPHIYRSNAVCVRKSDNIGNNTKAILAWIASKDRVTMASTHMLPDDFSELGNQFGNTVKKVEYKGSSKAFKGFNAGDTDLLYIGYTNREINAPNLNCFATTDGVNGTAKFSEVFPGWNMSKLVFFNHLIGASMNGKQKKDARNIIIEVLENDPKLSAYYNNAFIPTTAELEKRGLGFDDFWADVTAWADGSVSDSTMKAWKKGKLK